jgi:hypothetical protein
LPSSADLSTGKASATFVSAGQTWQCPRKKCLCQEQE